MSEAEKFGRVLASLHDAALDPTRWPGASRLIDEALGTHGSTLALGDGDPEEGNRVHFAWTCLRGERRPDLERLYFETYYPLDERIPRLRRAPFGRLLRLPDFYTEAELRTSAAYHALSTHAHSGNGIDVRLVGPGRSRICWEISDPVDGESWSSAQLETIRELLPHIRQTVRVQHTLSEVHALGATLKELLDATGVGVVQLDARGRIVATNDHARNLLRTGASLADEDGFLVVRSARENDELQAHLSRALPPFGARGAGGSLMVGRLHALPPLVLHVHPVGRQEFDVGAWPVAAIVLVVDPARGVVVDPDLAAVTLGLTGMEARVAVLLAQGLSVAKIAATMGRTESTIRSHVKHMLAKHRFSRQADLVRLVQALSGSPEARR